MHETASQALAAAVQVIWMHLPQPIMGLDPCAKALDGPIAATSQYGHCDSLRTV